MQYTMLGRTGLKVSRLGFGAMRLPMQGETVDRGLAIPMIHRAFEAGVTYIDTAVFYCQQDSQRVVGEALKGWRDRIVLSTKNHCFETDEKAWWTNLENSLERLAVQHIDIYNTHGINAESYDQFVVPHIYKCLYIMRQKWRGYALALRLPVCWLLGVCGKYLTHIGENRCLAMRQWKFCYGGYAGNSSA